LAYFLRRLSLDLVGIARARKGDVVLAGEKFCETLRQLIGTRSRITSVKSEDRPCSSERHFVAKTSHKETSFD
jgi:hypothetical protein